MKFLLIFLTALLLAAPAYAQQSVVVDTKADLLARGIIPNPQHDNCDAFQITARVAWKLRASGARLIEKNPAQNGCTWNGIRYSHDAIQFPGGFVDVLHSAGPPANVNGPAWDFVAGPSNGLTVEPFDMDLGPEPAPVPEPPVAVPPIPAPLPSVDLTAILLRLDALEAAVREEGEKGRAETREFRNAVADKWKLVMKYALPALGALLAGRATK